MGRSRGGLTTKIHALVDAEGPPIRIVLTPGQAHDSPAAEELLANLKPGATLLGDKAFDSNALRNPAKRQDVWANIPPKSNLKGSFVFSAILYRNRDLVERFFNKLKQFRGISTRYDENPENFLAAIKLASAASGSAVMRPRPSVPALGRVIRQTRHLLVCNST
jgi:transposase